MFGVSVQTKNKYSFIMKLYLKRSKEGIRHELPRWQIQT